MMKVRVSISEIEQAIAENKVAGLDFVEIVVNAVPVPEGWRMVPLSEQNMPQVDMPKQEVFDHPAS